MLQAPAVYRGLLDDQRARSRGAPSSCALATSTQAISRSSRPRRSGTTSRADGSKGRARACPLKSSLLVSAASLIWKYKKRGRDKQVDSLFKAALASAEGDARPARLYEQILRSRGKWSELAQMLLDTAEHARSKEERVNLYLRAARVLKGELGDRDRAAACYERTLDFAPGNGEAMAFLVEHFTERSGITSSLYETRSRTARDEAGPLQLGMVHWRFRNKPDEGAVLNLRKMDRAPRDARPTATT
jgi:hypothetical protein